VGVELDLERVAEYAASVRQEYESSLKKLVDLPSVSMEPDRKEDIRACAEMAMTLLKQHGATAEIVETRGYPVVIGEFHAGPGYPTVSVYNHLDVQPADASEWRTSPFEMQIQGDVYRGRGTTDDKGPALAVLYAAAYAHNHGVKANIKFIWELEEEIGSPSFAQFLKDNKAKLATDSVVVSDTIWVSRERPAIPYGLRGLQACLLKLKTGVKDIHSGTTGGLARNPIGELADLIAKCYDAKSGEVKFPGFYDDALPVSKEELDNFVASGFTVEKFKADHELHSTRTNEASEGAARIWARPTFEVHGITGGYSGPGVKTIVPHQAEAKISMRLVPNQDPEKIIEALKKFIAANAPEVELVREGTLRPFRGEFSGPYAEAAKASMKAAFGVEPAFTREGGSIGAVVSMQETLGVPIIFMGLSLPEHGYHAINENFDWQQASGGMRLFVEYFERVADMKK
jgi:acetylornithine deacetylase/succinyl-diaminopimelate desuccinylase-like protein